MAIVSGIHLSCGPNCCRYIEIEKQRGNLHGIYICKSLLSHLKSVLDISRQR